MSMLKGLKLPRRGDRDSSTAAGKPPVVKIKKAQANELAILISRLQKNADQVEKDIIDTEDKLAIDIKNLENGREFQYRAKNAENLSRAEGILKDLFLDSEQVKQLKHPQGEMINRDIHQLHDRWSKLCAEYRQVYEQVNIPNMRPQVDWLKMVGEKRYSLNRKGFGSDLVTVEMQMAEHNIIHKEIEAYGPHVKAAEGDPGTSTKRQKDLNELHTYMQRCTRELMWLDSEQEERKGMDWSDRNLDYDMRTRKYENIVNNELVAKEASINQIQDEGEKLLAAKHPAKPTIEAHMDAVENDWKRYLNLLICEEAHLKFMTEHHKFNKDAKESNEWLTKQSADMKRRYTVDPNDSALRVEELFKEVQEKEKEMDAYEKNVVALRNRATQIVPLKYRREKIPKPLTVETLCDYEDGELVLHRGDKYTLKDNSDKENWVVSNSAGKTETVPSACFVIPPTDPDSIALADRISTQFSELKQKRRETEAALRKRAGDVKQQAGQVLAADNSEERECVKHISDLERIYYELDDQEQQMLTKLRTPLDKNRPAEDGASRLREQDAILKRLQVLNTEKAKVVKSAEAFLSRKPKCPSAPKLRQKLDETDTKYTRVSLLANNYGDKAKAASGMEVSLQKAEGAIAPLERSLALEQSIPTDLAGIRTRRKELEAVKKDLGAKKALVLEEPARNLQNTQQHSQNVARNFNERCPDVERQESEVNRLRQRFGNMGDQTNLRLKELDNAEKTYSEYRGNYDNLDSWLDNVPKPSVSQNETVESINAKIADQKRLADELRRKETEKNRVEQLANDYQSTVRNYETASDRYRTLVEPEMVNGVNWDTNKSSPTRQVQDEERQLVKKFAEVSAANQQQIVYLQNMQNIVKIKEITKEVVRADPETERQAADLKKQLAEEKRKSEKADRELDALRIDVEALRNRKPEVQVKEVVKVEKDPEVVRELNKVKQQLEDEVESRKATEKKYVIIERRIKEVEQAPPKIEERLVIKEVAKVERDPKLEEEVVSLRKQLQQEVQRSKISQEEIQTIQHKFVTLENTKPKVEIKEVIKEVVKVEKDPEVVRELNKVKQQLEDEVESRKATEKKYVLIERRIKEVEQAPPKIEERLVIKEVAKVERDPKLEEEVVSLRKQLQQEIQRSKISQEEIQTIQHKFVTLENTKPKVEIKEVIKEVVRADPETERQAADLKKQLAEEKRKSEKADRELNTLRIDVEALRNRKPEVQVKEVVKVEKDPEVVRELNKVKQQLEDEVESRKATEKKYVLIERRIKEVEQAPPKLEERIVIKETVKFEKNPAAEEEATRMKKELDREMQKRTDAELQLTKLQNKIFNLENQPPKIEEKVVIQESIQYKTDPNLEREVDSLKKSLNQEKKRQQSLEEDLGQLRSTVSEQKQLITQLRTDSQEKNELEQELRRTKNRMTTLEQQKSKVEEKVVYKEVVKVEQDPEIMKEAVLLRSQLNDERSKRNRLEDEVDRMKARMHDLEIEATKEKIVYKEVVKIEKDKMVDSELEKLRGQLDDELRMRRNKEREMQKQSEVISDVQSEIEKLKRKLTDTDKVINSKEGEIVALRDKLSRLENRQPEVTRTSTEKTQSHLSRKIVVMDPETGKEMTPYEAYKLDLIDWKTYSQLAGQECDWEEVSVSGPKGISSSLRDKKTGTKFSIEDALASGKVTQHDVQQYKNRKMTIAEFAAKVSGQTFKPQPEKEEGVKKTNSSQVSSSLPREPAQSKDSTILDLETPPIAGVFDVDTNQKMQIKTAISKNLIDPITAQKLLEAQAATGGIIDVVNGEKYSVHKAADMNLIDSSSVQRLLGAQKAYTGIEDPTTKERLPVGIALKRGWLYQDAAYKYLEAQFLTGGLVDPNKAGRVPVGEALALGIIDNENKRALEDDKSHPKDITDPISKKRLTYKEALNQCKVESSTGLPLLKVSSKSSGGSSRFTR
ncbi:unnamed protein product [Lampetra planeri]